MIFHKQDRVLVQGITGKQGTFWTERMMEYGTAVIGGVNPKKAGTEHCGVPVFASAREAIRQTKPLGGLSVSVRLLPPLVANEAAHQRLNWEYGRSGTHRDVRSVTRGQNRLN